MRCGANFLTLDSMKPTEGRKRVIIEEVKPQVDCGRYPAKRILGDEVVVTAAVFGDGHDHVAGRLLYRHASERSWRATPLTPLTNDLWTASFVADKLGGWSFTIEAWVDHFDTWCADLQKRLAAQPDPERDRTGRRRRRTYPWHCARALRCWSKLLPRARERMRS